MNLDPNQLELLYVATYQQENKESEGKKITIIASGKFSKGKSNNKFTTCNKFSNEMIGIVFRVKSKKLTSKVRRN